LRPAPKKKRPIIMMAEISGTAENTGAFLVHKPLPPPPASVRDASSSWLDQAASFFTTIVVEPFHEVEELFGQGARSEEPRFTGAAPHAVPIDVRRFRSTPEPHRMHIDVGTTPRKAGSHLQGRRADQDRRASEPHALPAPHLQIQISARRASNSEDWGRPPPSLQSCPARPCLRLPIYQNCMGSPKSVTFSAGTPLVRVTPSPHHTLAPAAKLARPTGATRYM
jgi:hypothetical protein